MCKVCPQLALLMRFYSVYVPLSFARGNLAQTLCFTRFMACPLVPDAFGAIFAKKTLPAAAGMWDTKKWHSRCGSSVGYIEFAARAPKYLFL